MVFEVLQDHPSQEQNHQSVVFRQFTQPFRKVSRISNSLSLGKCHQVGHALFACVACDHVYSFHHTLSTVQFIQEAIDHDFSFELLAIEELQIGQLAGVLFQA